MKVDDSNPTARLRIPSVNGDFVVAHVTIHYINMCFICHFGEIFYIKVLLHAKVSCTIHVISVLRSNCQKYT